MTSSMLHDSAYDTAIAIIGMAGRFPGAPNIDAFWQNIAGGVRSIRRFSDAELLAAGVDPELIRQPNYVKAGTVINDADRFDAGFFGYPPREAEVMDPQHRVFLETAWEALEHAAYAPETYAGLIGVFAGSGAGSYIRNNLATRPDIIELLGKLQVTINNEPDSLASTVSYKLNLRGPSVAVQSFCSTSLLAVHLACQSLITYECDIALAGGVVLTFPHGTGYLYEEGGILSPDGYCRTFDANAQGSVMGDGVGVVALKRLKEALADGDQIYAIIRGSATNNDGLRKVGYTAPGLAGQTSVIVGGIYNAGVSPETISYIEAHGTATPLGDAVELAALLAAFAEAPRTQFCALGSVKPNLGHLDRASGVTGLIKTTLALYQQQLPPSLDFERPSPDIDLAHSPFYVNTQLRPWPCTDQPRRAGVNSFGLGGTNVHVVLEEAPPLESSDASRPWHLLLLAAKSASALERMSANLADHLATYPETPLADVAYTLQVGRTAFNYRRAVVVADHAEAIHLLRQPDPARVFTLEQTSRNRPVAFLLGGMGEQYVGMGRALYENEPVFRQAVDECCTLLEPQLGLDLRTVLYPSSDSDAATAHLTQAALAEPAVFVVEYALVQLLAAWGIKPTALLGDSLGEYVAACVAGVLSLPDGLRLVATRAHLIDQLPRGAMMQPIADELTALVAALSLHPPQIPYVSNVTGDWITTEQATDPAYWTTHLVQPVRFGDGIATLLERGEQALVEIGPAQVLGSFVKQHPACSREQRSLVSSTLPAATDQQDAQAHLLTTLGTLWLHGVTIDWASFSAQEQRRRVALPTYPFERQRFWIEPGQPTRSAVLPAPAGKRPDIADWFYLPTWKPAPELPAASSPLTTPGTWLIFMDQHGLGDALAQRLQQRGQTVIQVRIGEEFERLATTEFKLSPGISSDYHALLSALRDEQRFPTQIVHLWSLTPSALPSGPQRFAECQQHGFYSLLGLSQALIQQLIDESAQLTVVTERVYALTDAETPIPEYGPVLGICNVLRQENLNIRCSHVDVALPDNPGAAIETLAEQLLAECAAPEDLAIAYRDTQRWMQQFEPLRLEAGPSRLRQEGVYLITGGLGGVGMVIADHLARIVQAKLVLVGRSAVPPRAAWDAYLAAAAPDDRLAPKLRQIQALEALGADVLLLSYDVANAEQMQAALDQTLKRFGALHGVVHAAGISDDRAFGPISDLQPHQCEAHFGSKVYGLYTLEQTLQNLPLDFCLLCSSLSTVLGGLGLAGYAAANSFIDSFTHRHNRTQAVPWISVDWDTWELRAGQHEVIGATIAQFEMNPAEGVQAFERVINVRDHAQLVNSTGDLDARIRQWVQLESLRETGDADAIPDAGAARPALDTAYVAAKGEYEQRIAAIWQHVLGIAEVGMHDNFFDLGGNSLIALQVIARLKKEFKAQLPITVLFEAPTVHALADYLRPAPAPRENQQIARLQERRQRARRGSANDGIAIIGMVGRFPGADSVEQFWQNLQNGVESLTCFSDEELLAAGVDPRLIHDPSYVKARPILNDVAHFDAAFFGYTPGEAELLDPQQRLFHECAWEALEVAGYDSLRYPGLIGVFGGANINAYLMRLVNDPMIADRIGDSTILENDKDALATSVSYKLNLSGPSLSVQTYCSTSLVATHLACRSLRNGECDMALAGGVSLRIPVQSGHLYREGDQVSPDGHCRTFDAQAQGATFGDGVALVVLKRLDDALADGDMIHAVIRGSAINNDGGLKVGYTAPSVQGQTEVIRHALEDANLVAENIGYIEAHGTATPIGDPIEVAALTKAFRATTDRTQFCFIGSVKPNVGHLDRAAGVTGLIKTVLALKHAALPATLHFQQPNPEIDFATSPFVVTTALTPWPRNGQPRRAGVSALGVGGTNAHVIVEEAPALPASGPSRPWQLLLLAAKTPTALETMTAQLAEDLRAHPDVHLADVAYTLQVGRRHFAQRRMLLCGDTPEAIRLLGDPTSERVRTMTQPDTTRSVAFLLGGVGEQYVGLGRALYELEPVFRQVVDECCDLLRSQVGLDLRHVLWPEADRTNGTTPTASGNGRAFFGRGAQPTADGPLAQTALAQPAVFVVEYALVQLLAAWGIRPSALLGYSLGEYVAACVAGVLSLPDALRLVATRARLIDQVPQGAMLTVALSEPDVRPYLSNEIALAAVNGPRTCVLAGPPAALDALHARLSAAEIACRPVATTHAFHTPQLQPIAHELTALVATLSLHPPQIPYVSNVTGDWITAAQATDPRYWATHLVQPVLFGDGIAALLARGEQALVEVGPGQALGSFVKQHPACTRAQRTLVSSTLPAATDQHDAQAFLLTTVGTLWLQGVSVDWAGFSAHEQRRRVALPTYPFERQRFWLEPSRQARNGASKDLPRREDLTEWFSVPSWKRSAPNDPDPERLAQARHWLILADSCGVASAVTTWLRQHQQQIVTVLPGSMFAKLDPDTYTVRPQIRDDYEQLLQELVAEQKSPSRVVHMWMVTPSHQITSTPDDLAPTLDHGFYSLLALTQALDNQGVEGCEINIVSSELQDVTGAEPFDPAKATVIGPCKIIPQEYPFFTSRSIDMVLPRTETADAQLIQQLVGELTSPVDDDIVALRGPYRWTQSFEPLPIPGSATTSRLRQEGVYLITGGLGGIGLALADYLYTTVAAKLVLVGRTALPDRAAWPSLLTAADTSEIVVRRIQQVQALEARGAEVLLLQADVANVSQIVAAVAEARTRFGTIHGVFHTAGVPGVGLMQLRTPEAAAGVLAPKVHGTLALCQALRDLPLDFLVLFSSITSATGGGPGQVDYCAANAFLDAFARQRSATAGFTVAVSWGEWQWDAWSEGLQGFPEEIRRQLIVTRRTFGISFEDGMEALRRILTRAIPHVFVTTQDLTGMVELSRRSSAAAGLEQLRALNQSHQLYPRPAISTSYVEPRNDLEQHIATIWGQVLGIDPVGIDDNFFDLGGNSLLGIDLLARLRKALNLDRLPAYVLYDAPSVAALAQHVRQLQEETDRAQIRDTRSDKRREKLDRFKRRAQMGTL